MWSHGLPDMDRLGHTLGNRSVPVECPEAKSLPIPLLAARGDLSPLTSDG